MRKSRLILPFIIISTLFLTSCKDVNRTTATSSEVQKKQVKVQKKLVIGYDIYEPYAYIAEDGKCVGIDIDIAKEACKRMGWKPEFKRITWGTQKKLLKDKTIDCVWSGFSENGRQKEYQWTKPYLKSHEVVVVRADSKIKKLADLQGKKVAVQLDTKAEEYFLKQIDTGKNKIDQVLTYTDLKEAMAAFNKGYADAIAAHEAILKHYTKSNKELYRFLDEPIVYSNLGVAFSKDHDSKTVTQLSDTLRQMNKDGTIQKIIKKYGIGKTYLMEE